MTKTDYASERVPFVVTLLVNAALAGALFIAFNALPLPSILPCTHPVAQSLVRALGVMLILHLLAGVRILSKRARLTFAVIETALILSALWLGSYPFSPFGFTDGRIPVLSGFTVTTRIKGTFGIMPGEVITLGSGSPAYIKPVTLPVDTKCDWSSARGGALDATQLCDTVYVPPQADYDILRISIRPGCGLPQTVGQIKISILP